MLQIGAIASLTSLVHLLRPDIWVLVQILICAVTLRFTGGMNRPRLRSFTARCSRLWSELAAFITELSVWGVMALIAIGAILVLSLAMQAATPIYGYDERMYHASRVLYWMQNQSVFPYVTHNIRQTIIPFGSELFFLWPVLLTKTEIVGRIAFWSAYPLAAIGQYLLLRTMKLGRTTALVGVLILISTPLVASSAIGLKPEVWSIVTLLGVAYWAVSLCLAPEETKTKCLLLGVFTVLSINVRPFPVAILPSLILVIWWAQSAFSFSTRLKAFAAGLICAGVMSSLLIPLVSNTILYRHPLGPPEVRHLVEADTTPKVVYTHAVRFAFLLLELPDVPASAETRANFSNAANHLIASIGAGAPLTWEDNAGPWPGKFAYSLPEHSKRFSLWGLLWIPTLLIAALSLMRNVAMTWPQVRLTPISAQSLLVIPLLGAILFGARWMVQSEVPGRYLIGPYALLLPVGIAIVGSYASRRKFAQAFIALVVAYSVYQPISDRAYDAVQTIVAPISAKTINEPFEETVDLLPTGSRILFVGNHDAPDYPLFSSGTHYSNTVIPWGSAPFDPVRMRRLIDSEKVTHVLIQDDLHVVFHWFAPINTAKMVSWLAQELGLNAIPLSTPKMRLFETTHNNALMNERAFDTVEAPSSAPLIIVDKALRNHVGIDPTFLKTPWPVENLGGAEGGFLWIGQGYQEGVEFGLWSRQDRAVDIRFNVSAGPSLTTPGRKVVLLNDGMLARDEQSFAGDAAVVFHIRLHAGRNVMSFFALDAATVKSMPNGDARHLVAGVHDIQIVAAAGDDAQQGSQQKALSDADDSGANNDLARSARKTEGFIVRNQHVDGYWLTAYTSGERFELSKLEMNTFVTSTMIDILDSKAIPAALGGSLERARTHLRSQIEADGLVRYHGRPDARAMTELGLCAITPDTDDTALVWRIAPGVATLRATALTTLMRYRTAEGLYKTWLGQPKEYSCIDPGKDPNPTDVGIQMHVLMLLAQADPAEARSLCGALRQAIDQDRLWVYYRRAPLVPVLRESDLHAAGCEVDLPASRSQTAIPGQGAWLAAVQMLQHLRDSKGPGPDAARVLDLLRELSKDDFAFLKLNPPLLYHNDLTASVPRFYWSKDVGYAIWLRLYSESVRRGVLGSNSENSNATGGGHTTQKPL
jgi:hypothetical protein